MAKIDLNADLGESFGNYKIGGDSEILEFVSSANIACGFHAGDPIIIKNTISEALQKGVAIGAHPSYPDLQGFGRRKMVLSDEEVYSYVLYQVAALKTMTEAMGGKLQHVKAHGALYNAAAEDLNIAVSIALAVKDIDSNLILFGLPGSELENASLKYDLRFAAEAFADRAYMPDGSLCPREQQGSVIDNVGECRKRVLQMVADNNLTTLCGELINIRPQTICLHGDNPEALSIVKAIVQELTQNGIEIKSFS